MWPQGTKHTTGPDWQGPWESLQDRALTPCPTRQRTPMHPQVTDASSFYIQSLSVCRGAIVDHTHAYELH